MRSWLLGMGMMLAAGSALAGDLPVAPPSPMVDPYGGKVMAKAPAVSEFALGGLHGQFGATTFEKTSAATGAGSVEKLPGQDLFNYLCYDLPSAKARVWLAATDEMGNAGNQIDSITVKPIEASDPRSKACPALPARFGPVSIDGRISLGMTRQALVAALGQPSLDTGGWMVFHGEGTDRRMTITVRIDAGKVAFLYASNTSTD